MFATEQAEAGICWRCKHQVQQRDMEQWFLRITAYQDQLLEDMAVLDVTQSRLSLVQARDKLRIAGQAIGQAEENLRSFRERFRQGVALNSEVIDAELLLFQAKIARTQAAIDIVLAQARLEKAVGI